MISTLQGNQNEMVMQRPIKVLILIDQLYGGGAQEYLYQLVKNIDRKEVEFVVAALRSGGYYRQKLEDANVKVIALNRRTNPLTFPIQLFRLFSLARKEKFDICHSFLEGAFVMSLFLSIGLRTPLLHSILAYRFQTRRWYYPLMALVWPLVYCYVTFYEPDKFEKMGIPKDKLRLIEVTVHVSREQKNQVAPVDNPSIGITGNPLVVSAGRLHPHKGHEYVIRAWKNVVRELPDARLAIAGEGDDEERLRRLVSALNLEDHVDFTGYLQDLESLFKRATIYVRASLNEGTNLTTILAMSIGVPTIGFRNADVKEIIDDGVSGLLVPYKNEKKLAEEIIRLSKDADLQHRMSEAAIATIHQQYSLAEAVENYKNLYQSIIFPAKLDE